MGLVETFVTAISRFFGSFVDLIKSFVGDAILDPFLRLIVYTPRPIRDGTFAIFREPTNGAWPSIYQAYLQNLGIAVAVLFVTYLAVNTARTTGILSAYQTEDTKNGIVTALAVLPFGWPVGSLILHFFHALTTLIMPDGTELSGLFLTLIGAVAAGTATPGLNVLSSLFGLVDILVICIAALLYLSRIFFLMLVMYAMPILLAFALTGTPVLAGVCTTLLKVFVKLAFLPVIVAVGFDLTQVLFNSSGHLTLTGGIGFTGIAQSLMALVLPLVTIAAFYLVMRASFGQAGAQAISSMQHRYGGTSVAGAQNHALGDRLDAAEDRLTNSTRRAPAAVANKTRQAGRRTVSRVGSGRQSSSTESRTQSNATTETQDSEHVYFDITNPGESPAADPQSSRDATQTAANTESHTTETAGHDERDDSLEDRRQDLSDKYE